MKVFTEFSHLNLALGDLRAQRSISQDGRGIHKVFVTAVAADSIARQKLSGWPGQAAYVACGWCKFQGQKEGAMRF